MNVFHAFSGVDSQLMAEKRVWGNKVNLIGTMEVDIDAIISSGLIHHNERLQEELKKELNKDRIEFMKLWLKERNIGYDFEKGKSKIDRLSTDKLNKLFLSCLLTRNYGDISLANKVKLKDEIDLFTYSSPCQSFSIAGKQQGLNGVSGLLLECKKFIEINKPKFLLLENVKNLVGKKFIKDFENWLLILDGLGYNSYWEILNAKDFGVPQNRERVFCLSIRKDIDKGYNFPTKISLEKRLKHLLDDNVYDKYYLKDTVKFFINNSYDNASTSDDELKSVRLFGIFDTEKSRHQAGSVWDKEMLAPTLDTMQGGYRQPLIIDRTDKIITMENYELAKTIGDNDFIIRRLTPRECWRLMDFDEDVFDKVKNDISDTQLYKQAGNSIVVSCLEYIFKNIKNTYKECD